MAEEQTPVEETQVEEITTTTETLLPEPEQTETPIAVTDGWALAEGIPGEGDQPEWFKGEKYKSVSDQAKAYVDLEKQLGTFTGAPEEYEVQLEDAALDTSHLMADPMLDWFKGTAKELNMSQDSFNKILNGWVGQEVEQFKQDREKQIEALGTNAPARLQNLTDWGKANLSQEEWELYQGVATSSEGVRLLEALVSKTRETPMVQGTVQPKSSNTPEELRKMRAEKNDSGQLLMSIDAEHRRKVQQAYRDYYGDAAVESEVVGAA
jgi:hypothetical protein